MRLLFICIAFIFINLNIVLAQKHDYVWLFGKDSQTDTSFAGTVIDFNASPPDIYYEFRDMNFNITNASICDANGNLLFYTNGINVYNWQNEIMENGAGLNPGEYADNNQDRGYVLEQGAMALPVPDSDSLFYLIHVDKNYPVGNLSFHSKRVYFSLIDMSQNGGSGKVLIKNELILESLLNSGHITATRHANGRDWWIVLRKYGTNEYYSMLAGATGIVIKDIQQVGDSIPSNAIGQAVFSPDGTKYARMAIAGAVGSDIHVNIYDFDRCTGELSEPVHLTYADSAWSGGAAISPNSRYLYISSYNYLYQYDLWAEDIPATKDTVAVWDGFTIPPVFATRFFLMQLAPNGKIYFNSSNAVPYLHAINNPDLPGDSCDVCQHCVALPSWNSFSLPNFPNYRLGHLEGSPCDTLRQPPTAAFGYEQAGAELRFADSSYHDIRSWRWDFGDGQTDTLPSPVHVYDSTGLYQVCLAVANPGGEDTACEEVAVVVSGLEEAQAGGAGVRVYPNPTQKQAIIAWEPSKIRVVNIQLLDIYGKVHWQREVEQNSQSLSISTDGLEAGVYIILIRLPEGELARMLVITN